MTASGVNTLDPTCTVAPCRFPLIVSSPVDRKLSNVDMVSGEALLEIAISAKCVASEAHFEHIRTFSRTLPLQSPPLACAWVARAPTSPTPFSSSTSFPAHKEKVKDAMHTRSTPTSSLDLSWFQALDRGLARPGTKTGIFASRRDAVSAWVAHAPTSPTPFSSSTSFPAHKEEVKDAMHTRSTPTSSLDLSWFQAPERAALSILERISRRPQLQAKRREIVEKLC
ncbi:uncharacterized protein EV422DRAFT_527261 [Fimicolochytrium jonesii]|uniref:uncharacterized protein n=1 Tax=Fimicolochytrium jonesii TaxID=1396493 RepID=UPI0022FF1D46|nr:uncharacterized protein EV422DRAFT_527261 [Fimicolochytrium jonesii]KAI8821845.1 hypothetical protein EV422DRAFT_527261 [Fimicolochytrium jonesii]